MAIESLGGSGTAPTWAFYHFTGLITKVVFLQHI